MHRKFFKVITAITLVLFSTISVSKAEESISVKKYGEDLVHKNNDVRIVTPTNAERISLGKYKVKWENRNAERKYRYKVCIYYWEESIWGSKTALTEEKELEVNILQEGIATMQILYYDYDSPIQQFMPDEFTTQTIILGINRDVPDYLQKQFLETTVENPPVQEEKEEEKPVVPPTKLTETIKYLTPKQKGKKQQATKQYRKTSNAEQDITEKLEWNTQGGKVGGISSNTDILCKYKYLEGKRTLLEEFCKEPELEITESKATVLGSNSDIVLKGKIARKYKIQFDNYKCEKEIRNFSSWFKCKDILSFSDISDYYPKTDIQILVNGKRQRPYSSHMYNGEWYFVISTSEEIKNLKLIYETTFLSDVYRWQKEFRKEYEIQLQVTKVEKQDDKPFTFPFVKSFGVTQWHGHTAFQRPHTGIDFGVAKENTVAIADGEVVGKGWDSYYGACASGGNFLTIKHNNGMYSVYFHLEKILVDIGQKVAKGQNVAITGNSGKWNCQNLAYHLHLETRLNRQQSSHSDPVTHISWDWDSVPTKDFKKYPGRLSGDNPHPGR